MPSKSLGDMVVRIVGDNKQFDESLDKSEAKFKNFADKAGKIGKSLTKFVTVPLLGMAAAAVKFAVDAEETRAKFGTAFRDIRETADATAKNLANNFGLSTTQAERLLSGTGDLLKGFGATEAQALELSSQVQELAVDLASYNNVVGGADRASGALTSALLGEREALKSLGIVVNEEVIQAILLKNGQEDLEGQALLLAKAQATLQAATEQSQDAIGDFARTSGSTANQMRILRATAQDVAVEFGKVMLPAVNNILGRVSEFATKVSELTDEQKKLIVQISGVAAAIGPLLIGIKALTVALTFLMAHPVVAAISGIALLTTGVILLTKHMRDARDAVFQERIALDDTTAALQRHEITVDELNNAYLEMLETHGKLSPALAELNARFSDSGDGGGGGPVLFDAAKIIAAAESELKIRLKIADEQALNAAARNEAFDLNAEKARIFLDVQNDLIEAGDGYRITLADASGIIGHINEQMLELGLTQQEIDDLAEAAALKKEEKAQRRAEADAQESDRQKRLEAMRLEFLRLRGEAVRELGDAVAAQYAAAIAAADAALDKELEDIEKRKAAWRSLGSGVVQIINAIGALGDAQTQKELRDLDERQQKALEAAGVEEKTKVESIQAKLDKAVEAGEEETAADLRQALAREKIIEGFEAKRAAIEEDAALRSWEIKLASAVASGALAIINGFATRPFLPSGLIAGALATVLAGAQIAAVKQAKPFAEGGIVTPSPGGTLAQVAEAGQPEVIFPLDQLESFLSQRPDLEGGAGGDIRLVVNMDSKPILDSIFPATKNRTVLIDARAVT